MKPLTILAIAFLLQLSLPATTLVAQELPSTQSSQSAVRVSSNLVLVPVIALSPKTGLPDKTLQRDDFHVFDNGHPVSIASFDSGGHTRPLALWFVVQCSMESDQDPKGSGFFRGQISLFKPALKYVEKEDAVAVAHWCDNGDSKLDLLPTTNVEAAATTLEQVLLPSFEAVDHERTGELALQKTMQLIIDATRSLTPEPVPVLVFLYGDHSGMPRSEADHFIDQLLETSAIAFGLRDRRSPQVGWLESRLWGEQAAVAHYIAAETGGQYLTEAPESYARGLEEILQQLHFRYELGFTPQTLDGRRHHITVKLSDAAKSRYKGLRLRFRMDYVPARHS